MNFDKKKFRKDVGKCKENLFFVYLGKDSDSAESLLDSAEYRIPPNPVDSAEFESES